MPKSGTLSRIVGSYKAAVTRKVKQQSIGGYDKIWQRNYYEHIIRNEKELLEIRKYIRNNPIANIMNKKNYDFK